MKNLTAASDKQRSYAVAARKHIIEQIATLRGIVSDEGVTNLTNYVSEIETAREILDLNMGVCVANAQRFPNLSEQVGFVNEHKEEEISNPEVLARLSALEASFAKDEDGEILPATAAMSDEDVSFLFGVYNLGMSNRISNKALYMLKSLESFAKSHRA